MSWYFLVAFILYFLVSVNVLRCKLEKYIQRLGHKNHYVLQNQKNKTNLFRANKSFDIVEDPTKCSFNAKKNYMHRMQKLVT